MADPPSPKIPVPVDLITTKQNKPHFFTDGCAGPSVNRDLIIRKQNKPPFFTDGCAGPNIEHAT
jgi:hypothetical protein